MSHSVKATCYCPILGLCAEGNARVGNFCTCRSLNATRKLDATCGTGLVGFSTGEAGPELFLRSSVSSVPLR